MSVILSRIRRRRRRPKNLFKTGSFSANQADQDDTIRKLLYEHSNSTEKNKINKECKKNHKGDANGVCCENAQSSAA